MKEKALPSWDVVPSIFQPDPLNFSLPKESSHWVTIEIVFQWHNRFQGPRNKRRVFSTPHDVRLVRGPECWGYHTEVLEHLSLRLEYEHSEHHLIVKIIRAVSKSCLRFLLPLLAMQKQLAQQKQRSFLSHLVQYHSSILLILCICGTSCAIKPSMEQKMDFLAFRFCLSYHLIFALHFGFD